MLFFSITTRPPISSFFFFNDTATTEIYTLSLHDALPILADGLAGEIWTTRVYRSGRGDGRRGQERCCSFCPRRAFQARSEEHTSELQSHLNLVCRLLLEKKKK